MDIQSRSTFSKRLNKKVKEYTLTNSNGMLVSVSEFGCTITKLGFKKNNGAFHSIILELPELVDFIDQEYYLNCIVGRYANRISKGRFELDQLQYQLAINNGAHHLHGGQEGFNKKKWESKIIQSEGYIGVKFYYLSPHLEEGYPGNLRVNVCFRLNEQNELDITYQAQTDQKTHVNLTHHTYFNLGPKNQDILNHFMRIHSNQYLEIDKDFETLDAHYVEGNPFDFRTRKRIGNDMNVENEQLIIGAGYDHSYLLKNEGQLMQCAEIYDPSKAIKLTISTTEPGVQFYTGNHLPRPFFKHAAFCLETQHYPNSPNRSDFPSTILKPNETYFSRTVYSLDFN